jgi:hypothetical protein
LRQKGFRSGWRVLFCWVEHLKCANISATNYIFNFAFLTELFRFRERWQAPDRYTLSQYLRLDWHPKSNWRNPI